MRSRESESNDGNFNKKILEQNTFPGTLPTTETSRQWTEEFRSLEIVSGDIRSYKILRFAQMVCIRYFDYTAEPPT